MELEVVTLQRADVLKSKLEIENPATLTVALLASRDLTPRVFATGKELELNEFFYNEVLDILEGVTNKSARLFFFSEGDTVVNTLSDKGLELSVVRGSKDS